MMKRNPVGWVRIQRKREEAARTAKEAARVAREQEEKGLVAERAKAEAESKARIAEAEASKRRAAAAEAKAKAKTAQLELQKLEAEERLLAERRATAEIEATIEKNRQKALSRVNPETAEREREREDAQRRFEQLQMAAVEAIKQAERAATEHDKARGELLQKQIEAEDVLREVKKAQQIEAEAVREANYYILPPDAVSQQGAVSVDYLNVPPKPTKKTRVKRKLKNAGLTVLKIVFIIIGSLAITILANWIINHGGVEIIRQWIGM